MTATVKSLEIFRQRPGRSCLSKDYLAVEEPLEIRLLFDDGPDQRDESLCVTMRTPGNDLELAAGFLYGEGLIEGSQDLDLTAGEKLSEERSCNRVYLKVRKDPGPMLKKLRRNFFATSSCGICGKASIQALREIPGPSIPHLTPVLSPELIHKLGTQLDQSQKIFGLTGGLHGAALFDFKGKLTGVREDVGRHNAVDKLIGSRLLEGAFPLQNAILMVSGRTSFEIVQKAVRAASPILAGVSAPSSLAVDLARSYGVTLLGFVRGQRFNVYSGFHRLENTVKV